MIPVLWSSLIKSLRIHSTCSTRSPPFTAEANTNLRNRKAQHVWPADGTQLRLTLAVNGSGSADSKTFDGVNVL